MSLNEKKVPKRRFKEFQNADEWELRKLTEEVELYSGLTYSPNDVVKEGGTLVLRSSNVKNGEVVDADNVYVNSEVVNSNNVNKGDIIIVVRNGSRSLIGKHGQIKSEMKNTVIGAFMTGMRSTNSDFTNALLSTSSFYKEIEENLGATINQITNGMFQNMHFMFPSGAEQTKIGEYFTKLDNLITLHNRKLEKLKSLKKAYLTDMFPAEGESKPKLRFAGFTDDWEQCKVKEIFKVTRGNVLAATKTSESITANNLYPVYSSQTKDNGLMGYYKEYLFDTAITWTTDGANAGTVRFREGKFYCTNVCGVLLSESGYANQMVSEALNLIAWKYVSKVGNPKLMNNIMSEIQVTLPKSIGEQIKIASYFQQLDNLITLHQRKLEKLQNIKKAYLSEMFI